MARARIIACRQPLDLLARAIFAQALADCSIERALWQKVNIETAEDGMIRLTLGEGGVDLTSVEHVRIIAFGKAARTMLDALLARLPLSASCDLKGVLIAPAPPAQLPQGFEFFAGGHPLPQRSVVRRRTGGPVHAERAAKGQGGCR